MRRWAVACGVCLSASALACSFKDREAGAVYFATLSAKHVGLVFIGLGLLFVASRMGRAPGRYYLPGGAAVLLLVFQPFILGIGGGDCGLSSLVLQTLLCAGCLAIATLRVHRPADHGSP